MRTYYNEWDEPTAAWLGELCRSGHLPSGRIDIRSIRDVHADDVRDFDQCHFFAGIGGWPLALRLAGYAGLRCWTGSPPCQPFSVAGRGLAQADDRHLAPVWLNLIRECRPEFIFGEQVADAIRHTNQKDMHGLSDDEIRDGVSEVVRRGAGRLSTVVQAMPKNLRDAMARREPRASPACACGQSRADESVFSETSGEVSGTSSDCGMSSAVRKERNNVRSGSVRSTDTSPDRQGCVRVDGAAFRPDDERARVQSIAGPYRSGWPLHTRQRADRYFCGQCAARELGRIHSGERVCRVLYKIAARDGEPAATEWLVRAIEGTLKRGWLDDLFDALEGFGYACGAAVLPACSVGAPHIRKRLFFGAVRLAGSSSERCSRECGVGEAGASERCEVRGLADASREQHDGSGLRRTSGRSEYPDGGTIGGLADANGAGQRKRRRPEPVRSEQPAAEHDRQDGAADPHHSFWAGADWIGCRDGKFRPVEPGILPLADGFPGRVGLLRGAGNAIVPQAAAVFIKEFLGAFAEIEI